MYIYTLYLALLFCARVALTFCCVYFLLSPVLALANSGGTWVKLPHSTGNHYIGKYEPGTGTATGGNVVYDDPVPLNGDVIGGYTSAGDATINSVYINDGKFYWAVGGYTWSGDASNNVVVVNGGTMDIVFGGVSDTSSTNDKANYNRVIINGGYSKEVIGGAAYTGDASYNSVSMIDGIVDNIYGAQSTFQNTLYNTVSISGGTINRNVYGAWSEDNYYSDVKVNFNSVVISGGHIEGNIIGGFGTAYYSKPNFLNYNTVTLYGNPTFGSNTILYGGTTTFANTGDMRTGNTLNVFTSNIRVNNISNFQHYNFAMPTDGTVGLTLTNAAAPIFQIGDTISVPYALPGGILKVGDEPVLLRSADSLTDTANWTGQKGTLTQGVSLITEYSLAVGGTEIRAKIERVYVNPQGKVVSEANAGGMGFVNTGADLITSRGMDNARFALHEERRNTEQDMVVAPFFALLASSQRYNTGSYVDIEGLASLTGLGIKWYTPHVDILLGAFFENGFGDYKTHNSISGRGSLDGVGSTRSLGGGILARVDVASGIAKGLYAEGSLRIGSLYNRYENTDVRNPSNQAILSYENNTLYYGGHVGLGYIADLTENTQLDLSAKYLLTHQDGYNVRIFGDTFTHEPMLSQRLRTGGRFSYTVNSHITPYIGGYHEHEFNGKAKASTYGLELPTPSLEGDTGIFELGLNLNPLADRGKGVLSVDLGVQGYVGKREGVSGTVMLKYEF